MPPSYEYMPSYMAPAMSPPAEQLPAVPEDRVAEPPEQLSLVRLAANDELLSLQIRHIMLQHSEDLKRMAASDAGRLAMESMAELRATRAESSEGIRTTRVV